MLTPTRVPRESGRKLFLAPRGDGCVTVFRRLWHLHRECDTSSEFALERAFNLSSQTTVQRVGRDFLRPFKYVQPCKLLWPENLSQI